MIAAGPENQVYAIYFDTCYYSYSLLLNLLDDVTEIVPKNRNEYHDAVANTKLRGHNQILKSLCSGEGMHLFIRHLKRK